MSTTGRALMWAALLLIVMGGFAWSQRAKVVDMAGDDVIQDEPTSLLKKTALIMVHDDPTARVALINRILAPVLSTRWLNAGWCLEGHG